MSTQLDITSLLFMVVRRHGRGLTIASLSLNLFTRENITELTKYTNILIDKDLK